MYKLVLGSYVLYKNVHHIALGYDGSKVKLINPLEGNRKLNVSKSKVTTTSNRCKLVNFEERDYLVTAKDMIISLTTGKVCKWGNEHRERREILSTALMNAA